MSTRAAVGIPLRFRLSQRLRRTRVALAGAIFAFLVGTIGTAWLAFDIRHADRVHPGVGTMGVALGGTERAAARDLLTRLAAEYSAQWLTLRHDDRTWQATLGDLGIQLDAEQTLNTALRHGRQGTPIEQAVDRWRAWRGGAAVAPALAFNEGRWSEALAAIAASVDLPARDARLIVERDARLWIQPGTEGRRVNSRATLGALQAALAAGRPSEFTIVLDRLGPAITEAHWQEAKAVAAAMLRLPVVLTFENRRWELNPAELAQAIVPTILQGGGREPRVNLDRAVLRALVERVASAVYTPPRNATLAIQGGQVAIVRGTVGRVLDADATVARVEQALRRDDSRTVAVATGEAMPALTSQDLGPAKERAERALGRPVVVTYGSQRWTLSPATLMGTAAFVEVERQGRPDVQVRLNPKEVSRGLQPIAAVVNRPARNARFDISGNKLVVIQAAQSGIEVNLEAMAAALTGAIQGDERTVPLRVAETAPQITAANGPKLIGSDLIMDGSTAYGGTLPARMHNIELAAQRLNGTLVPPGEVFSFNDALGPATLSSGFKVGYGIILREGQPETVPSDAGGICQVATTLFHAVFWAGYKVEERNWHLYWIARYGQPPRGRQGLDATVDDVYGVDFQFRNNTPDWLLVQAKTDGKNLTFRLYGTKPGWDVQVEGPFITNVVKANPAVVNQKDPSLAPGQRVQIEAAADGFGARFVRTVVQEGQVVDRWVARSSYIPARNVVLVGPESPAEAAEPAAQ